MGKVWKITKAILTILLVLLIAFGVLWLYKSCNDGRKGLFPAPSWMPRPTKDRPEWLKWIPPLFYWEEEDPLKPDPDNPSGSDEEKNGKYTVTFYLDADNTPNYGYGDGIYHIETDVAYGTVLNLDEGLPPLRGGHVFTGWTYNHILHPFFEIDQKVRSNMSFYAEWEVSLRTVTFDADGGTLAGEETMQTNADGRLDEFPADPTYEGYIFEGWHRMVDGEKHPLTLSYVYFVDETVYAKWRAEASYTVTFDANVGTLMDVQTLQTGLDGKLSTVPVAPTREGHVFMFWGTKPGCGVWIDEDKREADDDSDYDCGERVYSEFMASHVFTSDTILYAWYYPSSGGGQEGGGQEDDNNGGEDDEPKVYTVTFDANDGTLTDSETMQTNTDGKLSALPSNPSRAGYLFLGWFTAKTAGTQITLNTVFDKDSTVYARWKVATIYTITFDPNGGYFVGTGLSAPVQIQTDAYGRLTQMPQVSRSNFNFQDWYLSSYGAVTYSTVFTSNSTVTARWTEISYTVDFNMNGGMVYDSYGNKYDYVVSCRTGDGFKVVNPPSESYVFRDNYLFVGWYTDRVDGDAVDLYTDFFNSNTTLYAHWQFDDSTFGNLGDRVTAASIGRYSYSWYPSDYPELNCNNKYEAKVIFVFDSPTTYGDFDVSVTATDDYSTVSFEIVPANYARFVVDTLVFDCSSSDCGFGNLQYDLIDCGANGSFDVDDSFYTEGDCYILVWVYTSLVFYPDDSLATEILSKINCDSTDYVAEYKGFNFSDNFIVYIHTVSPDYAVSSVTFTYGAIPIGFDDSGSSDYSGSSDDVFADSDFVDGEYVHIVFGLDYSRLLGGPYGFPIKYLLDESGYVVDFTIDVVITPMTDLPNPDTNNVNGYVTVGSVVDIQYLCYYNASDGIVSFEYFGDVTGYDIFVYCPETGGVLPVLRHYTYECGGSVMFEWDGVSLITIKIYAFAYDADITSQTSFEDEDGVLSNVEYIVLFDSSSGLIYVVYSGSIGNYDILIFDEVSGEYLPCIASGVFGEDSDYAGFSYVVFDSSNEHPTFIVQSKGGV